MRIGLFIPCYIDQFYPQVAVATLELLEKLGATVDYPLNQTCCGQPMANAGCERDALGAAQLFVKNFQDYDYIVAPSGSCVLHVREHFHALPQDEAVQKVRAGTYELCEFLHKVMQVEALDSHFPHKVGLHLSCHGLRGMRQGRASEIMGPDYSVLRDLLSLVKGLELAELDRKDECCGFGGTFAVSEEAVSLRMGKDRIGDHLRNGAEVITAGDMSCLMHLEGILRRQGRITPVLHIAEILNGCQITT